MTWEVLHLVLSQFRYLGLAKETLTLLSRKNDPNARDSLGRTPLSWAAENGHQETIKILLADEEVALDPGDSRGMTPLLLAVNNGREVAVKLLQKLESIQIPGTQLGRHHYYWRQSMVAKTSLKACLRWMEST